jgi:hypothetical protein
MPEVKEVAAELPVGIGDGLLVDIIHTKIRVPAEPVNNCCQNL